MFYFCVVTQRQCHLHRTIQNNYLFLLLLAADSSSESSDGLDSDSKGRKKNGTWAAVLGTGLALAIVALVAYVYMKRKQQKDFSHRKLVEVFPTDPGMYSIVKIHTGHEMFTDIQ